MNYITNSIDDTVQINWEPSEEDILFYEEHGWFATPKILPDELLDNAIRGAEEFYNGIRDYNNHDIDGPANDDIKGDAVFRNNEFVSLQKKELRAIATNKIIAKIAAKLARSTEIRLFADGLMTKSKQRKSDKGIFGWHADGAYWPTCTSNQMITAWVPFQDCEPDMGAMVSIERSHKWFEDKEFLKFYNVKSQNLEPLEEFLQAHKPNYTSAQMNLKKGQVSFHHCYTIHFSPPNTSNKKRYAMAMHLQDHRNKYQKAYKPDGTPCVIGYDKLCRKDENGCPDYRDPNIFPVLWKK